MSGKKYNEYKSLDLPAVAAEMLAKWDKEGSFEKSITSRKGKTPFVFYEGPPSANGMPGIHHVMSRAIKDIFCRYKTLKGYEVKRKAGWDTHGLPIELGVEKEMGITKEDIGKKITIDEYNQACRKAVMKYTGVWHDLTRKMGYWVDMEHPYVTYENKYIESVWWLLKNIYDKGLLYKGYTIQPYSPAAGTGLSSHELNQPGCYRDVKDTTVVAQFLISNPEFVNQLEIRNKELKTYFLAWTTTPWTLPSNTALAVGPEIDYALVETFNQYNGDRIYVILANDLVGKHFNAKAAEIALDDYKFGDKLIPYKIHSLKKGKELVGIKYEQLLPYVLPYENPDQAFRVIPGDFVTTSDGTGIVHIAPTFGADDMRVAREAGVPPMLVADEAGVPRPLVDLQGKFVKQMGELGGKYVKNEYYRAGEAPEKSVDVEIAIKLKEEGKAFKVEKYEHNYPHCWRTDKPVLYYPLDSWFIKATAVKQRMFELNQTINWKPESTGTGRFGNWLENANDWNLSRSRYWGVPLPIWRTEDGTEQICIGSLEELKNECEKSVKAGWMKNNPLEKFNPGDFSDTNYNIWDMHRPYADDVILVSSNGQPMKRETDLIDVWFDSGAMPYAQQHYPFENKNEIDQRTGFPADFIAEGVDQTRGWFYTLHAIATLCFDSVAYKNVVSNGLVLDKNGQKMSKRLGNTVDPFETLNKYGADATRWYMITNAQPWDNLKFDFEGISEVQRKFFRALSNTYSFFALYANIDNFSYSEKEIPVSERPEIDRWIISKLNSLVKSVDESLANYEPTHAAREIQEFVVDHLSNWYVRLCRRRFWKGEYSQDKIAAYQTLYTCLETVAILSSPVAPFYSDKLFNDLNAVSGRHKAESVHIADFPAANASAIDIDLEERMDLAQKISSMVLSLRKKQDLKVRQPLKRILVPALDEKFAFQVKKVEQIILSEVNVKSLEILQDDEKGIISKKIKPNFKTIGPKYGKLMKAIAEKINAFGAKDIKGIEIAKGFVLNIDGQEVKLDIEDVEITTEDIPGWLVLSEHGITVALDIEVTQALKQEGIARELVNRIQNLRKDKGFDVTDKIKLEIRKQAGLNDAVTNNLNYICAETLAASLHLVENIGSEAIKIEVDEELETYLTIEKI